MTTITRELIAAYLNGEVKTLTNSEQKELARIALASRGAKPIGITDRSEIECLKRGEMANVMPPDYKGVDAGDEVFVYTAPPAPAVPATLPCAVELKPGLIIGKGCKTETLLTALQRRADYYAEIDAMTPEERAEHDANIEAFKAMLPQPAPVVPDRYIFENWWESQNGTPLDGWDSLRTTDGYCDDGIDGQFDAWNACRAAMLNHSGDATEMGEAIKQQSSIHTSNGAMSGDAVKQPSNNASSLVFVDEIAEQSGVDPAITDAYMQGYHDSEGRKPVQVANDDLHEAVSDLLAALDEYPEQLVPINRKSFLVRTIRAAMLNKDKNNG